VTEASGLWIVHLVCPVIESRNVIQFRVSVDAGGVPSRGQRSLAGFPRVMVPSEPQYRSEAAASGADAALFSGVSGLC